MLTNHTFLILFSLRKYIGCFILFSIFVGCAPIPYKYYEFDYPGSSLKSTGKCSGPTSEIRIPFQGIFILANIGEIDSQNWFIYYEVPEGSKVKLLSDKLLVESPAKNTKINLIPKWSQFGSGEYVSNPLALMIGRTTMMGSDLFGKYPYYSKFLYVPSQPFSTKVNEGVLILPDMEINDSRIHGISIHFVRRSGVFFDTLNC